MACSKLWLAATALATSMAAFAAQAQTDTSMTLEEVLVSARKTNENLQTVPISISTIGAEKITEQGVRDMADVAKFNAALNFDVGLLPSDTRPSIRGVTTTRGRSNVAILVDSVDATSEALYTGGSGMSASARLMDLERVEVVKGPQSALYGRSAFSGAVSYITRRPLMDRTEVQLDGEIAQFGTQDYRFGASLPLVQDKLAVRVNLSDWRTDGWYDNRTNGQKLGGGDSRGGAVAFLFKPNDATSVYWRTEYSDEHYGQRAGVMRHTIRPGTLTELMSGADVGTGVVMRGSVLRPVQDPVYGSGTAAGCAASGTPAFGGYAGLLTGKAYSNCFPVYVGKLGASQDELFLDTKANGDNFDGTNLETLRSTLEYVWKGDNVEFASISGYMSNDANTREDFDLSTYGLVVIPGVLKYAPGYKGTGNYSYFGLSAVTDVSNKVEQYNQELKLSGQAGKLKWMADALYWRETMRTAINDTWFLRKGGDAQSVTDYFAYVMGVPVPVVTTPKSRATPSRITRETVHKSLALALTYQVTDAWRVNAEGRYLRERIDYTGTGEDFATISWTGGALCDFSGRACKPGVNSVKADKFVPRVSTDYQLTPDVFLYGSVAAGFKPGGVDTTDSNADVTTGQFKPEKLTAYELGVKTRWLDNRVQWNAAVFYDSYKDQQVSATRVINGIEQTGIINAGASVIKGLDTDFIIRATPHLTASAGYVYSDNHYTDFNLSKISENGEVSVSQQALAGNFQGDFTGRQAPMSAKHTATLTLRYEAPLPSVAWSWFAELNGKYSSKRYADLGDNAYLPAYSEWSLSGGLVADQWRLMAYVENLLDDDKIKSAVNNRDYGFLPDYQNSPFAYNLYLPQPRTVGLRAMYRF